MNITDINTIQTIWFEGFSYVKTLDDASFAFGKRPTKGSWI